jgi:hypothetical protein
MDEPKTERLEGRSVEYDLGIVIVSLGDYTRKKCFCPRSIRDVAATFGLDTRKDFVDELTEWFRGAVESIIDEDNGNNKDVHKRDAEECVKSRNDFLERVKREHPEIKMGETA